MACRDEGQGRDHDSQVNREQQERLDKTTRLLCELVTAVMAAKVPLLTLECLQWWEQHQKADAERRHQEERQRRADRDARAQKIAQLKMELKALEREQES